MTDSRRKCFLIAYSCSLVFSLNRIGMRNSAITWTKLSIFRRWTNRGRNLSIHHLSATPPHPTDLWPSKQDEEEEIINLLVEYRKWWRNPPIDFHFNQGATSVDDLTLRISSLHHRQLFSLFFLLYLFHCSGMRRMTGSPFSGRWWWCTRHFWKSPALNLFLNWVRVIVPNPAAREKSRQEIYCSSKLEGKLAN